MTVSEAITSWVKKVVAVVLDPKIVEPMEPPRMGPWRPLYGIWGSGCDGVVNLTTGKFWTIHRLRRMPVVDWTN